MTTYPAGLSKALYLDRFTKEGVEVGNYLPTDISIGQMPSYALVFADDHAPASQTTPTYVSWTSGTHTGTNISLSTSAISPCLLVPTISVSFDDTSGGSTWSANQGVDLRIQRSTDGGATFPSSVSQYFMFPCPYGAGAQQGSGGLGAVMPFTTNTSALNVVIRVATYAFGYNPSTSLKRIDLNLRVLVFNKI